MNDWRRSVSLLSLSLRFFHLLSKRRRWQLGGVLVLTLAGVLSELATLGAVLPFLGLLANPSLAFRYSFIADTAGIFGWSDGRDLLLPATLLFVCVALVAGGLRTLLAWVSLKFAFSVAADIGRDMYRHLLYQPYAYHVAHNTSEAIASVNNVNALIYSFLNPLIQLIVSSIFSIAILLALIRIDPLIALSAGVGFALIYLAVTVASRRRLAVNAEIYAKAEAARILAVQEGLGGIRDIILDSVQEIYVRRFWRFDAAQKRVIASNNFLAGVPRFLVESVGVVLIAAIAFVSTRRATSMEAVIPALGALTLGAQKVIPHMQQIYFGWAALAGQRAVVVDVVSKLDQSPSPIPSHSSGSLSFHRQFAIRNVSFRYTPEGPDVIQRCSIEIERGARIGIVGKTGSGKSTLIDLILGLLQPTHGIIEIDGVELSDTNRTAWQSNIAHVPQSIFLSDASIAENIALGRPISEIDMRLVREAARKAQLADFIETLPGSYDSSVGERGVRLSGGQQQRLGIARALYKAADVIVLDEATSALDSETEAAVMTAIYASKRNVTMFVIAHRLTTLRHCDRIIELCDGKLLRECSYDELMKSETAPFEAASVARSHPTKL